MADNDKQDAGEAADTEGTPSAAETARQPARGSEPDEAAASPDADAAPPARRGDRAARAPLFIALFALLLAALAAAGVALQLLDRGGENSAIAELKSEIERLSERLSDRLDERRSALEDTSRALADTRQAIAELQSASSRASGDLEQLERTLEARLETLEAIPARLRNLEGSLAALQGISSGLRDTWLLAEAEYYLQIANAQLQLADNPGQARTALTLADERLASLANPALTDVRRAIANELRRIDGMDVVELEGAVLKLASLANGVESLPLKDDMVEPDFDDPEVAGEVGGMQRALASLKASLSDVISVRRTDAPLTPLLPPEAAFFLRMNVSLMLQAARLAMLEGREAVYEQSLDDAAQWIREYFDGDSRQVASTLESIDELRGTRLEASKPDISGSLALLRQYMTLRSEEGRAPPADRGAAADLDDGPEQ